MDQPGKVANPARGQLNRKICISMSPFAPEHLVSRDGLGGPDPSQSEHSPHSGWIWCLLAGFLPISAAVHLFICGIITDRVERSNESSRER